MRQMPVPDMCWNQAVSNIHLGPSGYLSGIHDTAIYPIQEINEPLSRAG